MRSLLCGTLFLALLVVANAHGAIRTGGRHAHRGGDSFSAASGSPLASFGPAWYGADETRWILGDSTRNLVFEWSNQNNLRTIDATTGTTKAAREFGTPGFFDSANLQNIDSSKYLYAELPEAGSQLNTNAYFVLDKLTLDTHFNVNYTKHGQEGFGCSVFSGRNSIPISEDMLVIAEETAGSDGSCENLNFTLHGYDTTHKHTTSPRPAPKWVWPGIQHDNTFHVIAIQPWTTKAGVPSIIILYKTAQGLPGKNLHRFVVVSGLGGQVQHKCDAYFDQWAQDNEYTPRFETSPNGRNALLWGEFLATMFDVESCRSIVNVTGFGNGWELQFAQVDNDYMTTVEFQGGSAFYNQELRYRIYDAKTGAEKLSFRDDPNSIANFNMNGKYGRVAFLDGYVLNAQNGVLSARKVDGFGNVRFAQNFSYKPNSNPYKDLSDLTPQSPDVYVVNRGTFSNGTFQATIVLSGRQNRKHATIALANGNIQNAPLEYPTTTLYRTTYTESNCGGSSTSGVPLAIGCVAPPGDGTSYAAYCLSSKLLQIHHYDTVNCIAPNGFGTQVKAGQCYQDDNGNWWTFESCPMN